MCEDVLFKKLNEILRPVGVINRGAKKWTKIILT